MNTHRPPRARQIPAFAGMTKGERGNGVGGAGMTWVGAGMTKGERGNDVGGGELLIVDWGALDSRLRGNDVGGCGSDVDGVGNDERGAEMVWFWSRFPPSRE